MFFEHMAHGRCVCGNITMSFCVIAHVKTLRCLLWNSDFRSPQLTVAKLVIGVAIQNV